VNAADHGDRQRLDAVEHVQHRPDAGLDVHCGLQLLELAHVGADDEPLLLAGHDDEAADRLGHRVRLDALDDRAQFLERPASERVLAFVLAVEHGPGDALDVDREAPILQCCDIDCHHWSLTLPPRFARCAHYARPS